jgi:cell division protein FtsX
VLVRADSGTSVGQVQKAIEARFPNAQVASAKQVADQISGSLVDASNLSHRLGIALAALAALSAFLLAALLTLSSVGKRVRELGTLKALGWTQGQVVRQVVGESLAQGVAGGVLGVACRVAAIAPSHRRRGDRDRRCAPSASRSQCTHGDRSRGADCARSPSRCCSSGWGSRSRVV